VNGSTHEWFVREAKFSEHRHQSRDRYPIPTVMHVGLVKNLTRWAVESKDMKHSHHHLHIKMAKIRGHQFLEKK
jgi:hypothetical protein